MHNNVGKTPQLIEKNSTMTAYGFIGSNSISAVASTKSHARQAALVLAISAALSLTESNLAIADAFPERFELSSLNGFNCFVIDGQFCRRIRQ